MSQIVAVIVFLTAAGPVRTGAALAVFPTMAACQAALLVLTPAFELDRLMLERRLKQPVRYVTLCHDIGADA